LDWESQFNRKGRIMGYPSTLSKQQREAAIDLFEAGYGREAVATALGVRPAAAGRLRDRWRLWGREALVAKPVRQRYAFEVKYTIVQRFLAGETAPALAQEYRLSAPQLIEKWVRVYRAEGADGLRPKPTGRPKRAPDPEESELDRLRRENERLRAEVAYLGKLRALRSSERR
jgi:transposase-like protein